MKINPAQQVSDFEEVKQIMEVAFGGHFAGGAKSEEFRKLLQKFIGVRRAVLTNSGSSANLLAMSVVKHLKLDNGFRGEVITAAAGFPTTLNPIIQAGFVPVLIDVELGTYVPKLETILEAITPDTKAIILAHTLGNPFEEKELAEVCKERGIVLISDSCDALGSTYNGKHVGTYSDMATLSFYPAHHISTGEGGAVFTNNLSAVAFLESYRDWGRDCWCHPGQDNTCGKRFGWDFEGLPPCFDHKYTYTNIGYNLKMSDLHAAIGVAQMDKLPNFTVARQRNHVELVTEFYRRGWDEFFILPEATKNSYPSWFGFCLTVRDGVGFSRELVVRSLEEKGIGTRQLFGGNLARQPAYKDIDKAVSGSLRNSDRIMKDTFWIGCHPGIGDPELQYIITAFEDFLK